MKFFIITRIPRHQGMIGTIPEKLVLEEADRADLEVVKEGLHIPLGGECLIIPEEHVTIIRSKVVHEVVQNGR